MNIRRYLPILVVIVVFAAFASVQGLLRDAPKSELLQSQVGAIGNSLEDIVSFELEIELKDGKEIEMDYWGQDRPRADVKRDDTQGRISGEDAMQEIEVLVGALPSLTAQEPLTLIQAVLDQLELHQTDVKEFELDYRLQDGTDRTIELEVDQLGDNDDED